MSFPEDAYSSMSIASLGSSTIMEGPKMKYIHAPSQIFNEERGPKTYFNKPNFFDTSDIDGAQPRRPHQRSVPRDSMRVDDIDGASALIKDKFLHTKRHGDPLQPNYKLPSYQVAPPYEPKFIKDPLAVDDIDGTRSSVKTVYSSRDTLRTSDIEGCSAGWKPRHRILEERDIMATQYAKKIKFQDRTSRVSNSMKPSYCLHGVDIKDSPRSEPRKPKAQIMDSHLLMTADIEGAQAGYILKHQLSLPLDQRREFRNTNYIADIQGACADSVKHSIITKREMHPLQPVYQSLDGHGELLPGPNEPLIPRDCVRYDASSFKTSGVIRDGLPPHATSSSGRRDKLDIITHRSIPNFSSSGGSRTQQGTPQGSTGARSRQMSASSGMQDTGESFSRSGTGNAKSMNFFDTSDFGESKSYAEKFADSDCLVPRLETGDSGSRLGSARSGGSLTPATATSQASSRKSSRASVVSRRALAELEAEVNAIRRL